MMGGAAAIIASIGTRMTVHAAYWAVCLELAFHFLKRT